MPNRNVELTDDLDRFVGENVRAGRYDNAAAVVNAALRTLEREQQSEEAQFQALQIAIDEGDASGLADSGVFARIRQNLGLPESSSSV